MKEFYVFGNKLTGIIPEEIAKLEDLGKLKSFL